MKTPFLILSDAITQRTGLGKIARELAVRINAMPEFRVGSFGIGTMISRKYYIPQYLCQSPKGNMLPMNLPQVWEDFAGDEKGILFSIWSPAWCSFLSHPQLYPDSPLKTFLQNKPFDIWAYMPLDAEGPNRRLPIEIANIIKEFDRLLSYSQWESEMIERTLPVKVPHLPHGTDNHVYYPRDRKEARKNFLKIVTQKHDAPIDDEILLVSCVATNTPRKDWALAFETCQELVKRGHKVGLWAHTDTIRNNWELNLLDMEYGMKGRSIITTTNLTEEEMAWAYSACDVGLGIGLGEGWGMPMAEQLACGVPVVHCNYAGGTEFIPKHMLVDPIGFCNDGFYAHKRPVFRVEDWADVVERVVRIRNGESLLDPKFYWDNCFPEWEKWLREGLK